MAQSANPPLPPLVDDLSVREVFADGCAGATYSNGNLHLTFVTLSGDYAATPAPIRRVVSAKLVMTVAGAIELRDLVTQIIGSLEQRGLITTTPPTPPIIIGSPGNPQ